MQNNVEEEEEGEGKEAVIRPDDYNLWQGRRGCGWVFQLNVPRPDNERSCSSRVH